ncbi:MAG: cysteine desulfurase NifS [Candidatus Atribacteria bacterium]|nr:cysteine desulfurase NifS [Candidatus Atribacteria bacterium]
MIYLDYNATTPTDKRVVEAMIPFYTEQFGNPSSLYTAGQEAKRAVDQARKKVADLIHASEKEIIFTSGGTESDNLVLRGVARAQKKKGNHIIISSIEHHAVLNTAKALENEGYSVTYLLVNENGQVDPQDLKRAIRPETILVSIMHANNESGVMEPIRELAVIAHERGVLFHTDAVQTVGKLPIDVADLGVDFLSASAHKFYGPKGIGFLYAKKGVRFTPQVVGGSHEGGKRAGTENVPAIVGLGVAVEIAATEQKEEMIRGRKLRDDFEEALLSAIPEVRIVSRGVERLYNTSLVLVKYVEGESMLLYLDFEGIAVSTGSACSSSSLEPSHVLLSCGYPEEAAHGSIRFSLGKFTTSYHLKKVLIVFPPIVEKLRKMSPLRDVYSYPPQAD